MDLTAYNNILQQLARYLDLDHSEEVQFADALEKKAVRKRQFLVQPGFTCHHQTYVNKGAFRSYFVNDEGAEHTIQFAVEDWWISDFNSYINQEPASLFVEALEDAQVYQLSYEAAERLCLENPKFERYFRMVAQKAFAFAQRRILSNLGKSAEERFLEFQAMYPAIVQRVPQYMLASYLGMSAEFLSKVRKKAHLKS